MNKNPKRMLSAFLAMCMTASLFSTAAFAADTEEKTPICGLEEHTHTEECYQTADAAPACEIQENHIHDESCYQAGEPVLVCGFEESDEHTHTEECYQAGEAVLTCEIPEGHTHNEECQPAAERELICGLEEHTHAENCYPQANDASDDDMQQSGEEPDAASNEMLLLAKDEGIQLTSEDVTGNELSAEANSSDAAADPQAEENPLDEQKPEVVQTNWTYTVDTMATTATDTRQDGYLQREDIDNIADENLASLLGGAETHTAAPWGIYEKETYTIPATGGTGLENRLESSGIFVSLSDPGIHKLYITDTAAASMIPSWNVEKAEDGTAKVNGITIQGVQGSSTTLNLCYVHYPMESENADVVYIWKILIAPDPNGAKPNNTIPETPAPETPDENDKNQDYFWYGTEKPGYERVFATESDRTTREAVSMVMVPMEEASYDWTPDDTTWSADKKDNNTERNYRVVYCAEMGVNTSTKGEKYRIAKVIEESKFDDDTKDKLRAIIENSYPFLTADEANRRMGTDYDTAVLTAGTQYAIWRITDGIDTQITDITTVALMRVPFINSSHIYIPSNGNNNVVVSPEDSLNGETPIYIGSGFRNPTPSAKRKEAAANANAVANYLLGCTASELQKEFKIADVTEANKVFTQNADGTYNATISGTLSRTAENVNNETESVKVTLTDGINTADATVEGMNFTVTMQNVAQNVKLTLNAIASLKDRMQVYYYTSESGKYQNFLGGTVGKMEEKDSRTFTTPDVAKLTIHKVWHETDGTEITENLPESVTVNVLNGEEVIAEAVLSSENNWTAEVIGLPTDVKFTVKEKPVQGYESACSDITGEGNQYSVTITNTRKETPPPPETVSLKVTKLWKTADGTDITENLPESITVKVLNGETAVKDVTLNPANNWSETVTELPADGNYKVQEISVPGYTVSYSDIQKDGNQYSVVITNTRQDITVPETGNLIITKTVSGNRSSTERAFPFTLTLQNADGTPFTEAHTYTHSNGTTGNIVDGKAEFTLRHGESVTVSDLPTGIQYTVTEDAGDYSPTIDNGSGTILAGQTVTAAFHNVRNGGGGGRRPTPDTEINEPPVPQVYYPGEEPDPNEPDSPEEITIVEEDVPQTYIKTWDPENEEYVYLPEEPTPLASFTPAPTPLARLDMTPKTDDPGHPWLWIGLCFAAIVGIGLLKPRKKTNDK